jgi:hypothetical protein
LQAVAQGAAIRAVSAITYRRMNPHAVPLSDDIYPQGSSVRGWVE